MKKPTILIGTDGIEYIISGGKIKEKCQHRTRTDKSNGTERWEVCHDCGKTLIYNKDTTAKSSFDTCRENFKSHYGREPRGIELAAML